MKLRDLLGAIAAVSELPDHPALDQEVRRLSTNSHACQPGDVFIGMPGTRVDGGQFWPGAIAAGAIAALVSPSAAVRQVPKTDFAPTADVDLAQACVIPCHDMPRACAQAATAFYQAPTQQLQLVGVTGTNGKTTTTHLIEWLLGDQPKVLLGTLYARWPGHQETAVHTTPFAVELQRQFAAAVAAGARVGVMEVSSHALAQGRVLGCAFDVSVFTNLTQDHLDFHRDLEDYFNAKALLFSPDYLTGNAIVNGDDPYGRQLYDRLDADRVWRYSTRDRTAELWTRDLTYSPDGVSGMLHTPMGEIEFRSPLVGQFNLSNVLAAVGAALSLGIKLEAIAQALPAFPGVPGRMQQVQVQPQQDISVIVDYAHTPDSLENLLTAARPFIAGNLICVFGCGGDRDRTKRPQMGRIAARLSDVAIVTSDNPRTEDPQRILDDILEGIPAETNPMVIGDRAEAIRTAILNAQPGDGVLIAGKGHEDYQILGTEKVHFDDREQAQTALLARYGSDRA